MSKITIYMKVENDEIRRCITELKPRVQRWFDENPKRKVCKVDLVYGRSVDLRRENYGERLDAEIDKFIKSNAPLERTAVAGTLDGVVGNSGGDE